LKKKRWMSVKDLLTMIVSSMLFALSFVVFIFPNEFAPSGLPGIQTMIWQWTGFPVSYMNIIVNIPLIILTYILVDKGYALKSGLYSFMFSAWLMLFENVDMSRFVYQSDHSAILAPVAGGVLVGFSYAIALKRNFCTGGTDLIAELVHHYKPEKNMMWILFGLNAAVAALSYFVYDYQLEPVLLCLIYCFTTSKVCDIMLKGLKEAVKFEIVTDQPDALAKEIMEQLQHGVTEIAATGSFTKQNKTLLICVVNKHQIVKFQRILDRFPGSFAYLHTVKETMGYFDKVR
jgi:uncharacterized membrane-anchored protein YitT (DUF2179 family)